MVCALLANIARFASLRLGKMDGYGLWRLHILGRDGGGDGRCRNVSHAEEDPVFRWSVV